QELSWILNLVNQRLENGKRQVLPTSTAALTRTKNAVERAFGSQLHPKDPWSWGRPHDRSLRRDGGLPGRSGYALMPQFIGTAAPRSTSKPFPEFFCTDESSSLVRCPCAPPHLSSHGS